MQEQPKQKPHWPALFWEIIQNQQARKSLYARLLIDKDDDFDRTALPSQAEWIALKDKFQEMKRLRQGAENVLRWRPNEGHRGGSAAGIAR